MNLDDYVLGDDLEPVLRRRVASREATNSAYQKVAKAIDKEVHVLDHHADDGFLSIDVDDISFVLSDAYNEVAQELGAAEIETLSEFFLKYKGFRQFLEPNTMKMLDLVMERMNPPQSRYFTALRDVYSELRRRNEVDSVDPKSVVEALMNALNGEPFMETDEDFEASSEWSPEDDSFRDQLAQFHSEMEEEGSNSGLAGERMRSHLNGPDREEELPSDEAALLRNLRGILHVLPKHVQGFYQKALA